MTVCRSLALATILFTYPMFAQNQSALNADPPRDAHAPASMVQMAIPSHGEDLLGLFYLASGSRPHPTVVLMHGFPGYELNLDIAQAMRRAGWNVLVMHYRGSWGVKGSFSFKHAMEDADAEVEFLRDPAEAAKYHVDTKKIVLIGHSMGGFLVASATAHDPKIAGVVMISAWNIPAPYSNLPASQAQAAVTKFAQGQEKSNLAPLAGCTANSLGEEVFANRKAWNFVSWAPALASRPVLIITSNDGLAAENQKLEAAIKQVGNQRVSYAHYETDHAYSDKRIQLTNTVLDFLAKLP